MNFKTLVNEMLVTDTSQYLQPHQTKQTQIEFMNIYNKFMNESCNKTLMGFEEWIKNQEDSNKLLKDKNLYNFVAQKIGQDPRAYAVEA